jgi:hypothetical protein
LWKAARGAPDAQHVVGLVLPVVDAVTAGTLERLYPGTAARALERRKL